MDISLPDPERNRCPPNRWGGIRLNRPVVKYAESFAFKRECKRLELSPSKYASKILDLAAEVLAAVPTPTDKKEF